MKKRRGRCNTTTTEDLGGALAVLDAAALRRLVEEILLELDEAAHTRVLRRVVERAAREGAGWTPAPVPDEDVLEILDFVKAAKRAGYADPDEVDVLLGRGSDAFLRRDYATAHRIFGALLEPIGECEIDLGQDEMVYEVLGADLDLCAAQCAVSAYMRSAPHERPQAVLEAIRKVEGVAYVNEPLAEMERAALDPLCGFDDFLPGWRELLEKEVVGARSRGWRGDRRSWLREVAGRLEGAAGLADMARSSGSVEDYRVWCEHLVRAEDWTGALAAFEEAASRVSGGYECGCFLDGAARCARELGRRDVPARLVRAWRADPDLLRLARWLGTAGSRATLRKRVCEALDACPKGHRRQRALLHVLAGDVSAAANLLASAPGLGWSGDEHPGHLLFPLFEALLGGLAFSPVALEFPPGVLGLTDLDMRVGSLRADEERDATEEQPLPAPTIPALLARGGVRGVTDAASRQALVEAMRKAAERRLAGVTDKQRRRYYGHAAELVAALVASDPSPATAGWVASIRQMYRRYPALRRALDRHVGKE